MRKAGSAVTATDPSGRPRSRFHLARALTRVLVAGALGLAVFGVAMAFTPWQGAVLIGWDVTAGVFVAWVLVVIVPKGPAETAAWATREDDSRAAAETLVFGAGVFSLVAVAFGLVKANHLHGGAQFAITVVAILAVVLAWATVHTIYTLRYARLFYHDHGGIDINEEREPDYHDFLYVAFTIGMTYQVSDTNLTSKRVRRAALSHALLSYLYGTVIIAVTINVIAGLVH
jgi:uncharacterized membrane protein